MLGVGILGKKMFHSTNMVTRWRSWGLEKGKRRHQIAPQKPLFAESDATHRCHFQGDARLWKHHFQLLQNHCQHINLTKTQRISSKDAKDEVKRVRQFKLNSLLSNIQKITFLAINFHSILDWGVFGHCADHLRVCKCPLHCFATHQI